MAQHDEVVKAIFGAIDQLNQQLPEEQHLEPVEDAVLFGEGGKLDSLGLINLIVAVEEKIENDFRATVTLADDEAMAPENRTFETVGTLANYICKLLEKDGNG